MFGCDFKVRDTPEDKTKYDEWFTETNKNFAVNMDLMHASQTLDDFDALRPYFDLAVRTWSYFTAKADRAKTENDLVTAWKQGETVLEVCLE